MTMGFKCIKCKVHTLKVKTIDKNKMTKIAVCIPCFDKRQKWLLQRGLPLNK